MYYKITGRIPAGHISGLDAIRLLPCTETEFKIIEITNGERFLARVSPVQQEKTADIKPREAHRLSFRTESILK